MTEKLYYPDAKFSEKAHIKSEAEYQKLYSEAKDNPEKYWAKLANEELHWFEKWDKVLDWNPPHAKWFINGKINITYNCLDRHLTTENKNKVAIFWESFKGENRTFTYSQLHREVCKFANVLQKMGISKGDVVAIYMPMIPEAIIAILACARIGAIHTVIFSGFSPEALKNRLSDAQAKLVITTNGANHKGKNIPLKSNLDKALEGVDTVEKVIVVQHTNEDVSLTDRRDYYWHDLQKEASDDYPAIPMDSEDSLFLLYTSGSTGKPKGVIHTTGGYNLYTHITAKWVFDLKTTDIYWCTADIGWITGHSYVVYGPLSNGATIVIAEDAPTPSNGYWLEIIEKYGVSIFYTSPTAVRFLKKLGDNLPKRYNLSSLRLLGSVGEQITPDVWEWYYKVIGGSRCPIVDTYWQTETGGIIISPLPGVTPLKPGSATKPLPGIVIDIVNEQGDTIEDKTKSSKQETYLVVKQPWPGMMRGIYNDENRFLKYWEQFKQHGKYFYLTGDTATEDQEGNIRLGGRIDDVISVSGHRLTSNEIETALNSSLYVHKSLAVGLPHPLKGEEVFAFVNLAHNYPYTPDPELISKLKKHVSDTLGAIARPEEILFVDQFPETFSGKNLRRVLRIVAMGENIPDEIDLSTLNTTERNVLNQWAEDVRKMREK